MNILLAFKAEPDLTMLAEKDWQAAETGELDISITRPLLGMDEQAGAEMLLSQSAGQDNIHLTALSIGDRRADSLLRQFKALGYEDAVLIHTESAYRFSSRAIAELLAGWQQAHPQSLIVLGSLSAEGNNGQTGFWLAEMLGWPCFSQISGFQLNHEKQQITVTQNRNGASCVVTLQLPAVISVISDGQYCLRTPTLRQKLAVKPEDIQTVEATSLRNSHLAVRRCVAMRRNKTQRAGLIIDGRDAREKARRLYQDWLSNRMKR